MKMTTDSNHLCSDQKVKVITVLFGKDLKMSNFIAERIEILNDYNKNSIGQRRVFLDNKFK